MLCWSSQLFGGCSLHGISKGTGFCLRRVFVLQFSQYNFYVLFDKRNSRKPHPGRGQGIRHSFTLSFERKLIHKHKKPSFYLISFCIIFVFISLFFAEEEGGWRKTSWYQQGLSSIFIQIFGDCSRIFCRWLRRENHFSTVMISRGSRQLRQPFTPSH